MQELIIIAISALLVQNIILVQFLGLCPFLGVSAKQSSALGMGFAVTFIMVLASLISWLLYEFLLAPNGMEYLATIVFILIIASLVQLIEMFLKKYLVKLYEVLGIYLPLITTNCAILGVALIVTQDGFTFVEMIVYSMFSGLGFVLIIFLFSTIRERLEMAAVPRSFKGIPIALVIAAIMSVTVSYFGMIG